MFKQRDRAIQVLLVVLFSVHYKSALGIQVHEIIESDTTAITPTLLPTRVPKMENDSDSSMELLTTTTTTERGASENTSTLMPITSSSAPIMVLVAVNSTKQPRIQSAPLKPTIDSSRLDQQQRSTTNIDNKDFVPSPQIASPSSPSEYSRANVQPLNTNTRPAVYDPNPFQPYSHHQTQQPILPKKAQFDNNNNNNVPYFYNSPPTPINDNFVINDPWKVAPNANENGKWYWMPNGPQTGDGVSATRAPPPPSHIPQHWKWSFENKFNEIPLSSGGGGDCCANGPINDVYLRPSPTPEIHHSEHPFSFDPVDANKYGFGKPFHSHNNKHHPSVFSSGGVGDGVFGTQITETEYDHVVKGGFDGHNLGLSGELGTGELLNGQSKHKQKGVSPWKKILQVLTAAIPIGLLISAFTPQYVYVDPNSTSSQPPFSGKYENRYDHHNHHHIHRALGGETNAGRWFVPSNESLANLFVEVNALFATESQRPTSSDHESDDDGGGGGGGDNGHGEHDDNQQQPPHYKYHHDHSNNSNNNNADDDDDDDRADPAELECQFRDLCEISLLGAAPNSHVVHRMLWTLANEHDERPGINDGVRKLFRSVRERDCSSFECSETPPPPQQQQPPSMDHLSKANQ